MKNILNKITSIPAAAGKQNPTFANLIVAALDVPPQGGFTPSVMRSRARVDAVLSVAKAGDMVELEDADFETAKQAVASCPWQIRSPDLLELFTLLGL